MIKVENNIVTVNGLSIKFDSEERVNSFLLDYISKHGEEKTKKELSIIEEHVLLCLIEEYGCIEIEEIDLSVRSYNLLKRCGINYIEDVLRLHYEDVIRMRNMGNKSVREIQTKVNSLIRKDYIKWTEHLDYDVTI